MPGARDTKKLVFFVPKPAAIRDMVRRLAQDTANIKWSTHALDRMEERGITDRVAVEVLRRGEIRGDIAPGKSRGEWKLKMVREVKGRREAGVVVIMVRNSTLFVKTVEWEDSR